MCASGPSRKQSMSCQGAEASQRHAIQVGLEAIQKALPQALTDKTCFRNRVLAVLDLVACESKVVVIIVLGRLGIR